MTLTPMALDFAQKNNINVSEVLGSSEKGKINVYDLKSLLHPKKFKFFHHGHPSSKPNSGVRLFSRKCQNESTPSENMNIPIAFEKTGVAKSSTPDNHLNSTSNSFEVDQTKNPKSVIPHFSLKRKLSLDQLIKFTDLINSSSSTQKVELSDVMLKIIHLTLLKFPEFKIFFIGDKFLKAKELLIEYKSFSDPLKNIIFYAETVQSLLQYQNSNRYQINQPSIQVIDAIDTEILSFQPVLSYNNVS
jgi:hypothetical protein